MAKPRVKITDYKVVTWIDAETKRKLFGGAVFVVGRGWAYLEVSRKPDVHWSRKAAQESLDQMKSRRTRAGYLRVPE